MSRALSRVGVSQVITARLQAQSIRTCKDALSCTPFEFAQKAEISVEEATNIMIQISKEVAPQPTPLDQLYLRNKKGNSHAFIETNCPLLNQTLKGGIHIGSVTEIVGPCGLGKTQICFSISVKATFPHHMGGLNSGIIFIDTESSFSAQRMAEITRSMVSAYLSDSSEIEQQVLDTLGKFHVYQCPSIPQLSTRLDSLEEDIIQLGAKVVVIDSLASPARKDFDGKASLQRYDFLAKYASVLKDLAETYKISVIVTNQVTTKKSSQTVRFAFETHKASAANSSTQEPGDECAEPDTHFLAPALGGSWAYFSNTRIILEEDHGRRFLKIAKSPIAPVWRMPYVIGASGVQGVSHPDIIDGNYCENMKISRGESSFGNF